MSNEIINLKCYHISNHLAPSAHYITTLQAKWAGPGQSKVRLDGISIHSTDPPLRFWNMGLDPSSGRQDCCLWQHVSPTYCADSLYSPCNYCRSTTASWLSTAVAAAHPNKTAPFLRPRGTDGRFARHALYTSIRGLPKDWRRRPGRPRRTWLRTMKADLQPLNHGLNSAWRLAQDRERWKQLVETATLQSGACPRWW